MSRTPSDPAEFNPSQHSRPPSIAHYEGPCDGCERRINIGDPIQRVRGRELHIDCAGKE